MGILAILFSFTLIALFPLGQLLRVDNGKGVAFTGLDIGVGLLIVVWLITHITTHKKIINPYGKSFLFFIAVCIISLVFQVTILTPYQIGISTLYLFRFVAYMAMAGIAFDLPQSFHKRIPFLLFLSGIIIVVGGYIQYFLYPSLRNLLYAGWDEHLYRIFSSFLDPNFFGVFLSLYIILCLWLWKTARGKIKILYIATAGISSIALFLTYSRSSYLALGISFITFLFMGKTKKGLILLVLFGIITLFSLLIFFSRHSEGTNLLRSVSTSARFGDMQHGIQIFLKNPFFGVGFDAYRYAQHRYGLLLGKDWETGHNGAGVNNSFIFVLATTGIIGLSIFLWFLFSLGKKIWLVSQKNNIGLLALSSLIALIIGSQFENSFFYPSMLFWIVIIWGLVGKNLL